MKPNNEGSEKQVEEYEGLASDEGIEGMKGNPNDDVYYNDFGDESTEEDEETAEDEETTEDEETAEDVETEEDDQTGEHKTIVDNFLDRRCQQVS